MCGTCVYKYNCRILNHWLECWAVLGGVGGCARRHSRSSKAEWKLACECRHARVRGVACWRFPASTGPRRVLHVCRRKGPVGAVGGGVAISFGCDRRGRGIYVSCETGLCMVALPPAYMGHIHPPAVNLSRKPRSKAAGRSGDLSVPACCPDMRMHEWVDNVCFCVGGMHSGRNGAHKMPDRILPADFELLCCLGACGGFGHWPDGKAFCQATLGSAEAWIASCVSAAIHGDACMHAGGFGASMALGVVSGGRDERRR